ncbi:sugar transporter SWEET1 [Anoplophora glabripennis]|uniref:sugar transporter SWEET1 n=1 Tax=Anoplophora glabripennis TaxID=217634 RepID=UPI000873EDDC|nr:sugar transporter SWEET1 [Anoplophora glabripennis]
MNDADFKNILATTASICTILQFLTGTLVCQKIVQNKSTGDMSSFPFVSGCLSTSLWLRYGFLIQDRSLILVNTVGATLFFAYVVTFYLYSIKKTSIIRQFLGSFLFLIVTLLYIHRIEDVDTAKSNLGLVCCIVTILFFAAPLASLLHVIKVKSTDSLPYHLIIATFIVSLQWVIYGIVLGDKFIQIPNFLGCVLSAFQLSLFIIYPKNSKIYPNVI